MGAIKQLTFSPQPPQQNGEFNVKAKSLDEKWSKLGSPRSHHSVSASEESLSVRLFITVGRRPNQRLNTERHADPRQSA